MHLKRLSLNDIIAHTGHWMRKIFTIVMHIPRSLTPGRLLRQDLIHLRQRYVSDWTVFNQLIVASAVYVFFTNLLPGITFASDLYVLTGQQWGTIEVVFSTGLCGLIFSLYVECVTQSVSYSIELIAEISNSPKFSLSADFCFA